MVTNNAVFRAVADPTRRRILARLREAPLETGRIARGFPVSRPAISRHLAVLARAGLVRRRRAGRRCFYALQAAPLKAVDAWVARYRDFWAGNLDRLERFVESEGGEPWPTSRSTKGRSSRRSASKRRRSASSGRSRSRSSS